MICSFCFLSKSETHKLTKTKKSQIKRHCRACNKNLSNLQEYFFCENCEFFQLCQNCKICPSYHFLKKTIFLKNTCENYGDQNNYYCDICKVTNKGDDEGVWHCTKCEFDVCNKCCF